MQWLHLARTAADGELFCLWLRCGRSSLMRRGGRRRTEFEGRAESSIEIAIAKTLLQRGKCRFTSAVTGGNVLHFERIVERSNNLVDIGVACSDKVQSSC